MNTPTPAELGPLADLQHLANAADEAPAIPGAPVPEAPPAPPSQADQLAGILHTAGQFGAMKFPRLAAVYSEEKCRMTAEALTPGLERMGITLNHGETMVWIGFVGALGMLLFETRAAVIADIKDEQAKEGARPATTAADAAHTAPMAPAAAAAASQTEGVHSQIGLYQK